MLNVVQALTAGISRATGEPALYDVALSALESGVNVRRASILLFDDDGVMRFKGWRGLSSEYRRAVEGHTPWRPDTTDADIIVVPDVTADPELAPYLPVIQAERIRGMAFAPLKTAGGVIGKFMLYFDEPRALGESELTLTRIIADQVAFAVQRIRAEQAARDREMELRLVTDIAPVFIAHCDVDRRYKFVNRPFADRFGVSAEAVIGRSIGDVLGEPAYARIREYVDAVLDGKAVEFELDVPYQTIGRRFMHGKYAPEFDSAGRVSGFVAAIVDVTELRATEALFRQLADSLPQLVWISGPAGQPEFYNARCYEFTGFERGQDVDVWKAILHPDDAARSDELWHASVRSGEPFEIEYRLFDRNSGAYRWYLGRAVPVRDAGGRIVRWFGTGTDIDASKRSERAARFLAQASRAVSGLVDYPSALQTIAELALPDYADWCAVDIVDGDGEVRRIALSYWDRARADAAREVERRYPSREQDPFGARPVIRSGQPMLLPDITDDMLRAVAHDEVHLAALRQAGLRSLISVPLRSGQQTIGALTFLTSDSRRRYGAEDLAIAEELAYRVGIAVENARLYSDLQQGDRQKDEFLAVLAHELRNPLAPIRTALQLIRLTPEDRVRRDRACAVMDRQLQQMVRLVDDLLDVSRITRGKIDLQRAPTDLAAVVQNAVETSRPMIEAAGHQLALTLPSEPVSIDGDATRLAQVFANLLNNAAKYTPRGGRISITAERSGARAIVRVRDTGVGIPADMLTRIFDMFTQVDRSLEKTHGGLGIGLTLARRLIEMHGGRIEAISGGRDAGSEFIVTLPLQQTLSPSSGQATDEERRSGAVAAPVRRRVLVVDDNRDAAESLAEVLRVKGHEVRAAHDGVAALEIAGEFRPDVVLLDLAMPRMNGYDAARELRARLAPAAVLIAVTGWGQDEHRRRSQAVGFDHHLVKPVSPDALDALLASRSW